MEFNEFLTKIKREEKDFFKNFSPNVLSNSAMILSPSQFHLEIESNDKYYIYKNNATMNDFADYGEFMASVIGKFVGVNLIKTHLVHKSNDYGVLMDNFKQQENEYIALSSILSCFNEDEMRTYDKVIAAVKFFCEDNDIVCDESVERDLKRLILFDYLMLQQDRHGENIEFEISKDEKNDCFLKLAPIFDNEFCFLFLYDERIWNNYIYNEETFNSRIFAFNKVQPINALAKEIMKSEDLTLILEKFLKIDINKIIDLCDELSSKKMPLKYRNLVNSIFEKQKKKLCLEIKALSIKRYCEGDNNEF